MGAAESSTLSMQAPFVVRMPFPVTLHVYDLGVLEGVQVINRVLTALGTGAFHCGVQVHGREWSYQGSNAQYLGGVFAAAPRRCQGHSYCESIPMGDTVYSSSEVLSIVNSLRKDWRGATYDTLRRNCCHFSEALCIQLGSGSIPDRIKSLAATGAAIVEIGEYFNSCAQSAATEVGGQIAGCTSDGCCCCSNGPIARPTVAQQMMSCYVPHGHSGCVGPTAPRGMDPNVQCFVPECKKSVFFAAAACCTRHPKMEGRPRRFDWIEADDRVVGLEVM